MTIIYVVNFCDQDNYCAYTSIEKAREVIWDAYLDDFSEEVIARCGEQDKETLDNADYIEDYAWIYEVPFCDKNGDPVKLPEDVQ